MINLHKKDLLRFESNEELFSAAIHPISIEMHSGKGAEYKFRLYNALSKGQKAAFMFWVLYTHSSHESQQFYTWIPYMREPAQNYWAELTIGMNLFESNQMIQFIKDCESVFSILESANRKRNNNWTSFHNSDLEDTAIKPYIDELHIKFKNIAPGTIDLIGHYIRENVNEFLSIYSE